VVLCPDVAPYIDSRFDCFDLLQRSLIHYGTAKASAVMRSAHRPHAGQSLRRRARWPLTLDPHTPFLIFA
jgi:hypothetical protein